MHVYIEESRNKGDTFRDEMVDFIGLNRGRSLYSEVMYTYYVLTLISPSFY